jgi:hypothetical protein
VPRLVRALASPSLSPRLRYSSSALGQAGGGFGVLVGQKLHVAQVGEGAGLGELIARVVRGFEGGPVQGCGLVPVPLAAQILVHRRRDRGGVPRPAAGSGVTYRSVQVEALGAQPGQGIVAACQVPGVRRRCNCHRWRLGRGAAAQVLAGRAGSVHVVIKQPAGSRVPLGGRIGGGKAAGVLADQVMKAVAAPRRLGQQVMVIQALQLPPGSGQADARQRGSGVGVKIGARVLAQTAEHPLLIAAEVLIGAVESSRD